MKTNYAAAFQTVGELRAVLESLPDDTVLTIVWEDSEGGQREDDIALFESPGYDVLGIHSPGSLEFVPTRQAGQIGMGNFLYAADWRQA